MTEYIAERYGGETLLPPRPSDRATTRLFTELCSSTFSYFPILRAAAGDDRAAAIKSYREGLIDADSFLRSAAGSGANGPFLLGDRFSTAECNAAPFVQRACTVLPALADVDPVGMCGELGLDRLGRWIGAVLARPSVVATGVEGGDTVRNTEKMLERFSAAAAAEKK